MTTSRGFRADNTLVMRLGPWTVEAGREQIEVDLGDYKEPDPTWRFVDANGHGHFWRIQGKRTDLPTLFWVAAPCTMGHEDCTSEGFYVCAHCSDRITPGRREPHPADRFKPGPLHVTLTHADGDHVLRIYRLRGENAEAVVNDPVGAIPRITAEREPDEISFGHP